MWSVVRINPDVYLGKAAVLILHLRTRADFSEGAAKPMSSDDISLPQHVAAYKRTPLFTETTVPPGLLKDHATKTGVWGVIHVTEGRLRYVIPARNAEHVLDPSRTGIIMPTEPHRVEPLGQVSFFVEFHR